MMEEFLRFFDSKVSDGFYMRLEISYSKIADYCIRVWRQGTGPDGKDQELVRAEDCDIELAFARAYIQLKTWLRDHEGGY